MTRRKSIPELPVESPIPFATGCNGEFIPRPPSERAERMEARFHQLVEERRTKLGVTRRQFVDSAAGTALALMVIQQVGCGDDSGGDGVGGDGGFPIDSDATWDAEQACVALGGDQFVFDVQTHHVNPDGAWRDGGSWALFFASLPQASCGEGDALDCFDAEHYIREMFVNSDTHVAVLSAVPAEPSANPLEIEEAAATKAIVAQLADSERLVLHGLVLPDRGAPQIAGMERLAREIGIAAWKVYTPYGGWRLDGTAGRAFLDEARRLAVPLVCAHKGLPLPGFNAAFAAPDDLGVVAPDYPDLKFVAYHSAYDPDVVEGPYSPTGQGIDRLIAACAPHANVFAELGTTWRSVMTNPVQAQHVIGKLLLHLGPDRILWGTDSIWYGTPQDQLAAFRALTISTELQETYGYPALTAEIKAKILGLNAAGLYGIDPTATRCAIEADDLSRRKRSALEAGARATFRAYGPRTRRELFAFLRARDGAPG